MVTRTFGQDWGMMIQPVEAAIVSIDVAGHYQEQYLIGLTAMQLTNIELDTYPLKIRRKFDSGDLLKRIYLMKHGSPNIEILGTVEIAYGGKRVVAQAYNYGTIGPKTHLNAPRPRSDGVHVSKMLADELGLRLEDIVMLQGSKRIIS